MGVTIKDVARAAGVSTASISRAFQNPPSPFLSEERRKRILQICDEMHYYPNIHSRRMSQKFANNIVLLSRMVQNSSDGQSGFFKYDLNWGMTTQGILSELCSQGKSLQVINCDDQFVEEEKYLEIIRSHTADGILVWGALRDDEYIRKMAAEKIPFILLETWVDGLENSCVCADEYSGFKEITERVIAAGHRDIAVLTPSLKASNGVNRFTAVMQTLEAHGITPVWYSEEGSFDPDFGIGCAARILKEAPQCTCVIAPNDVMAWGCVNVFRKAGLRVPQDISVTGADGLQLPGELQLESFYLPAWEIGKTGARELCRRLYGSEAMVGSLRLPVTPVRGNSIAVLN